MLEMEKKLVADFGLMILKKVEKFGKGRSGGGRGKKERWWWEGTGGGGGRFD